jgi:hypothetical protein
MPPELLAPAGTFELPDEDPQPAESSTATQAIRSKVDVTAPDYTL